MVSLDRPVFALDISLTIESGYRGLLNGLDGFPSGPAGIDKKHERIEAFQVGGLAERYVKGEANIELRRGAGDASADAGDDVVILRASPFGDVNDSRIRPVDFRVGDVCGWRGDDQFPVIFYVPQLVQTPQGWVPSLVWLQRGDGLKDCRGDVSAALHHVLLAVSGGVAERELGLTGVFPFGKSYGCGVDRMVQCSPEFSSHVEDAGCHADGNWPRETDLAQAVAGLRIDLLDKGGPLVGLHKAEVADGFFNVLIRAIQ